MRSTTRRFLARAVVCAPACVAVLAMFCCAAQASPVLNIALLARPTGTTDPFSSFIVNPAINSTWDYEVVYTLLTDPVSGTFPLSNTHLDTSISGYRTSSPDSLIRGDGVVAQTYTLNQKIADASQVTFQYTGAGVPSGQATAYSHYGSAASGARKPRPSLTVGNANNSAYDATDHISSGTVISPAFPVPDTWTVDDGSGNQIPAGQISYTGTGTSGGAQILRTGSTTLYDLGNSTMTPGAAIQSGTYGIVLTNTPIPNVPVGNGVFTVMSVGTGNTVSHVTPGWKGFDVTGVLGIVRYRDASGNQVNHVIAGSEQFDDSGNTVADPMYSITPLTIVTNTTGGGAPGSYTLGATQTMTTMMKGDSIAITSTIQNNGANGTNDNVAFSNLGWRTLTSPNTITNLGGTTSGTLTTPDSVGATRTGTFNGNAYGTQNLTASVSIAAGANGQPALSGSGGFISIDVGLAVPVVGGTTNDGLTTFGTAITSSVLTPGTLYGSGSRTARFGTQSYVTGTRGTGIATTAELLDGQAGGSRTISMAWRTRANNEIQNGELTIPPGPKLGVRSDVVQLSGLDGSTGAPDPTAHVHTDTFVLQMSVSDAAYGGSHAALQAALAKGLLYLGWLDDTDATTSTHGGLPLWRNAVAGDFANWIANPENLTGVVNSYAGYYAGTVGVGGSVKTANTMRIGDWGVQDLGNGNGALVWAVLDHNSIFAAVPEPSSLVLSAIGLIGLLALVRRRRRDRGCLLFVATKI